jgi:hypothetical protein
MIPELVKAALAAYVVVGLVTIIAGGNAEKYRERRKRYKAYCQTKNQRSDGK